MKRYLIFLWILPLFYSCENREKSVATPPGRNAQKIEKWYNNLSVSADSQVQESPSESELNNASQNQPANYKAMVAIIKGVQKGGTSYNLSSKYYEQALQLIGKNQNDSISAMANSGLGSNYKNIGNYPEAFKYLYRALNFYERSNNGTGICNVRKDLAQIYFQKGNVELAKENILMGLEALKTDKTNITYLSASHTLANIYGIAGEYIKAFAIDDAGIRISDSIGSAKLLVSFLDNKANCFMYSQRYDSAQYYFDRCLKIDIKVGNRKQIADSYSNLGQLAAMKGDFPTSEIMLLKSVSLLKEIDGKPNLEKAYSSLTEMYMNFGKFEKAANIQVERHENYKAMIDEKHDDAMAEYDIVYETQKKENKIQILNREKNITALKLQNQSYTTAFFALLLISFIATASFWKKQQDIKNKILEVKVIHDTEVRERDRIAKDMHDDLGSGLSKINFLSELILQKSANIPDVQTNSEAIREASQRMNENMRDLIWALNNENNTLPSLVSTIRAHAADYLEEYPLEVNFDFPASIPETLITRESSHAIFMTVKEALNNITKHSKSTKVNLALQINGDMFKFIIKDNGIGFSDFSPNKGNGLQNIRCRIEAIGGTLRISHDNGTTIALDVAIEKIMKLQ